MPRDLTVEFREALSAHERWPVKLVDIDWPGQRVRAWTGTGPIQWDGHTWHGYGQAARIEGGGKSDAEIQVREVRLILSGVPSDTAALALDQPIRGRRATIYFALLRPDRTVIPDPRVMDIVDMDSAALVIEGDATCTIVVTGNAGFYTLAAPVSKFWTPEAQKLAYPTDVGLDAIPGLQNRDDAWTLV